MLGPKVLSRGNTAACERFQATSTKGTRGVDRRHARKGLSPTHGNHGLATMCPAATLLEDVRRHCGQDRTWRRHDG